MTGSGCGANRCAGQQWNHNEWFLEVLNLMELDLLPREHVLRLECTCDLLPSRSCRVPPQMQLSDFRLPELQANINPHSLHTILSHVLFQQWLKALAAADQRGLQEPSMISDFPQI